MKPFVATAIAVLGLSACSGGGQSVQSYSQMFETGSRISQDLRDQEWSPQSAIPTSGLSTYDGVFIATVQGGGIGDERVQGVVRIDADFSNNLISGGISNVVNSDEQRYAGYVPFENGSIDRTVDPTLQWTFGADAVGTLTSPRDNEVQVDAVLVGNFVGTETEQVVGRLFGTVTEDGQTRSIVNTFVVAED